MNHHAFTKAGLTALVLAETLCAAGEPPCIGCLPPCLSERDTLTGDWGGLRPQLSGRGVDFAPVYIGEVQSSVDGGAHGTGTVYAHSLNLPLTLDLEKLAGWKAATFHANAFWIAGRSLSSDYIGDIANASNISADPAFRLQELWLQQCFDEHRLTVQVGLIAADNQFFGSAAAALFINGTFGAFTVIGANLPNPPVYPMASPGARVQVQPSEQFYFQAAIFDGNAGTQDENPHGVDFPLATGDGALVISEIGWMRLAESATNALNTTLKAGAFVLTKQQPSWNSQIAGHTGGGKINYGIYGVAEQELFCRAEQKITAFARVGFAPADRNVVDWYFDAGFNFAGLVPGRPKDKLGLAVARSNFSRDYSRYEQSVHGSAALDSETVIEATYCAHLAPWWTVQPDFQYVIAPGGSSSCDSAVVIGLRTTIVF
jgi:porin